jgi:3-phenylpropionate/trans-cinnamate dioxygenase ferredoxin reductase subunit
VAKGVVIVGGGHGGSQVAASLRSEGYVGPVTLISSEADIPYQRPPLSKTYLKEPENGLQELRPAAFYESHDVDLRLSTTARSIDRHLKTVTLDDGSDVEYDHLVLATGSRPRLPPIAGTDIDGVFLLRDAADARRIHDAFIKAESIVVIGGGFIGLEIAATARSLGRHVTIVEATDRLMGRAVAPEISAHFLDLHRGWGSTVILGAMADGIVGDGKGNLRAVHAGGEEIAADLVVLGIGVVPNVELAQDVGLTIDNGIVVNDSLQTDDPAIFAIGDCVTFHEVSVDKMMRLESVQNAVDQAKAVAKTIVGKGENYKAVPWFWSDQQDVKLQMVGLANLATRRVIRGNPDDGTFSVFQFAGDRLVAIDSVNRGADHMFGRRIMDQPDSLPTPEQAADEDFDLKSLMKRPPRPARPAR